MRAKTFLLTSTLALGRMIVPGQTYTVDWSAITGGAATLISGGYSLDGSIGQSAAGDGLSAQGFTLDGGFVSGSSPAVDSKWVLRATNGPPARYSDALAYDSARGVTVLYGGGTVVPNVGYVGFGEVWEWNGVQWKQRTTYSQSDAWQQIQGGYWQQKFTDTPAARLQHAMVYDSRRGRVVMFGGRGAGPENGDFMFNDTWEWDGLRWYFRTTNGPPAQFDHHMAYDERRGVTVCYGGFGASAALVWEWDGTQWTSVAPTNGPGTSYYQNAGSMDYDPTLGNVFFGPGTDGFAARFFWSWDGQQWISRGTGFSDVLYSPEFGAMVFDKYRARSFYFGGDQNGVDLSYGGSYSAFYSSATGWYQITDSSQSSAFMPADFSNPTALATTLNAQADPVSTFLWNQFSNSTQSVLGNAGSYSDQITAALVPDLNRIIRGASIYDPQRFANISLSTETIIFQAINPFGQDQVRFNRLLLEDAYPSNIRRSPSSPTGRARHAMAYDSARHVTVLFGGLYKMPSTVGNETWELVTPDELVIEQQPLSQYQPTGSTAVFTVSARSRSGAALSYQWFFSSEPLRDAGAISGTHSPTLQIAGLTSANVGQYFVQISDGLGTVTSLPARLSLSPNLQIFRGRSFSLLWGIPNMVLEQADTPVPGLWNVVPGATSPFDVPGTTQNKFFRLSPGP
ncbi:MAG TPA: immunoglobulin domain-containing protein [Patescibacteria group bacterium]|nr:immunoglobulin domain-containing protein [Patescibacteria group bacterium]